MSAQAPLLTINDLFALKQRGEKITCLTAYDAGFSALIDKAGIEVVLVGDTLGMVFQGHSTTLPVTVDDMIYHSICVTRGRQRAFVITDMPFLSYISPKAALKTAQRLMQQGGAQMVKLEGAHFDCIAALAGQGVPVCGHLGLLPQSINQLGTYKVQGRTASTADKILADAQQVEQAGAQLLVLECIPSPLAARISRALSIPVIGIGAGPDCDGQVLVLYDILNIGLIKRPRFSKNFLEGAGSIETALLNFSQAVKQGTFPGPEHCYK